MREEQSGRLDLNLSLSVHPMPLQFLLGPRGPHQAVGKKNRRNMVVLLQLECFVRREIFSGHNLVERELARYAAQKYGGDW